MNMLKRIGLTIGSAILGYFVTFILWYVMRLLARIPIFGAVFASVIWSADLFFEWLGSWVGLNTPGGLAIIVAIGMDLQAWETSAPLKARWTLKGTPQQYDQRRRDQLPRSCPLQ